MIVRRMVALATLFCSAYWMLQSQEVTWSAVRFDGSVAYLYDVTFLSDGKAVAVGANAVVRVGDPSGAFPVVTGSYTEPALRTVCVGAEDVIVCAGDKGLIGFSSTKGQDWTFLQDEDWGDIRQVAAHRSKSVTLFASDRGVYRSVDGGAIVDVYAGDATAVMFAGGDTAYAALASGVVLVSSDMGATWNTHAAFTTTDRVLKMRYSGETLFVVHRKYVTFVNNAGVVDSTYIAGSNGFQFTDIAKTPSRWYATSENLGAEHAYSSDSGATWIRAYGTEGGYAMALSNTHIIAVGERGGYSYGPIDSCITNYFKFFGFRKQYERQWPSSHKYVTGNKDSVLVLTESPLFHLAVVTNDGMKVDTIFRDSSSIGNGAVAYVGAGTRRIILADTIHFKTVGSTTSGYRSYVVYASNDDGITWDTLVAPNMRTQLTNAIADNDGNVYFYGGTRYIYVMRVESMSIDSITNAPIEYCAVLAVKGMTLVAAGDSGIARSTDQGSTWQTLTYSFAATPRSLSVGGSGRLIALESQDPGFVVQVSDDLGDSWRTTYSYTPPVGKTWIYNLRADTAGQCIATGFSNGVYFSLDNAETWKTVAAPVHNASTLWPTFVGPAEFVVCGNADELLRGKVTPITEVEHDVTQPDAAADLKDRPFEAVTIELYDFLGQRILDDHNLPPVYLRVERDGFGRVRRSLRTR